MNIHERWKLKIEIEYIGRDIRFVAGDIEGSGFDGLVEVLQDHKDIEEVQIRGKDGSFTSKRQVYLFANMLHHLTGAKIILLDDGVLENGLAKVTYKEQ